MILGSQITRVLVVVIFRRSLPWAFAFFAILFFISPAEAQLPIYLKRQQTISLGGTFSDNLASTHIDAYSGSIFCGTFIDGSAGAFSLSAATEWPIGESFGLIGAIGYRDLSSMFTTTPFSIEHAFDLSASDTVQIHRERRYNVSIPVIGLSAGLAFHPFDRLSISAAIGASILPHSTFDQSESLLDDKAVYRENFLSTRPVASGMFDSKSIVATVAVSASYDFPFSTSFAIRPYLEAFLPITSIASIDGNSYHAYSLNAGAALVYVIAAAEEAPKFEEPLPVKAEAPIAIAPAVAAPLRLTVRAVGLTDNDEEVSQPVVSIEKVVVTDVSPTLAYLFFDDGSNVISTRYHQLNSTVEARSFSTTEFYKLDAVGINHELLNILGKRLIEFPDATITLTGTRSVHSSLDTVTTDIALARAQTVSQYLQHIWNIRPSRIRIRSRTLPEMSSDDSSPSGQAENRRVEIAASTRELLAPVETRRIEQTATPPRIKFYQDIFSGSGISSNKIVIRQGGRILETIDGLTGDSRHEWLWNITQGNALSSSDSIFWTMEVTDSAGGYATVGGAIKIKPQEHTSTHSLVDTTNADKLLSRFHLLLFDYSSTSELGKNADELLNRIATAITPDASVTIIGHTDLTGDAAFNDRLSYDRASKASLLLSNKLRFLGRSIPPFDLEARGSKEILFDNAVPEGRMLSRTVRVTVERSLK